MKGSLAMMAYRSSVHESLGVSPVQMLFGHDINLPVDLLLGKPPQTVVDPLSGVDYVDNLKSNLYLIHNLVRDKMCEASARQKRGLKSSSHTR